MTTLDTEIKEIGLKYDRMVTDTFVLPYSLDSIKIQPNELAVARTFNLKINKLFDNLVYLYGLCKVASFNIPRVYEGWIGAGFGDLNLGFYPADYATSFSNSILSSAFYQSTQATSFFSTAANTATNIIFTSDKFISVYGIDPEYNPVFIISQTSIDPLSGSICFSKIGSVTTYNDEVLFVSDTLYNNIYSYKLKDTVSDDNIKSQKLFLHYSIGGAGTSKDKIKFNSIGKILYANNGLIVEDYGNRCFKVYDKELNWINTSVAVTFFEQVSSIKCMAFCDEDHRLYACSDKTLYLFNVSPNFDINLYTSYDLSNIITGTDSIIDIKFAFHDPGVFYILTRKSLIKKWITKPTKNIGILATNNNSIFDGDDFKWFTVTRIPGGNQDLIIAALVSQDLAHNYMAVFRDDLNLTTLFKTSDEAVYYSRKDVQINPNEYNASWVYNKSFKKLLYNMSTFVNNIGYRFFSGENVLGTPVYTYRGYNNFFRDNAVLNTNTFSNVYINENFQSETINRCFKQIYDYQLLIMNEIISNEPVFVDLSPRTLGGFQYQFYTGGYS